MLSTINTGKSYLLRNAPLPSVESLIPYFTDYKEKWRCNYQIYTSRDGEGPSQPPGVKLPPPRQVWPRYGYVPCCFVFPVHARMLPLCLDIVITKYWQFTWEISLIAPFSCVARAMWNESAFYYVRIGVLLLYVYSLWRQGILRHSSVWRGTCMFVAASGYIDTDVIDTGWINTSV